MSPKRERDQKWVEAVTPEIHAAVTAKAHEGSLTCAQARAVADELGIPDVVVGAAAEAAGIRIKNCALGCF